MKTGALIGAAIRLGALCGRPLDSRRSMRRSMPMRTRQASRSRSSTTCSTPKARTASLGKTAGKDAASNKATFVTLTGLAQAKRRALALREEARAALAPLGGASARLGELADWIVLRTK